MRLRLRIYKFFSSPRLTIFLLVYSVLMIFFATIAQSEIGIAQSQKIYFESFFSMGSIGGFRFPVLGGAFIGLLAAVNLVVSGVRFARFGIEGFGVSLSHMALVLLIISGALQYFTREEGTLTLREGSSSNLVFQPADASKYSNEGTHIELPFTLHLIDFKEEKWSGSSIARSYSSHVFFQRGKEKVEALIKMNQPASYGGWTFYQMSYAEDGKVSILSAVRNPARLLPWLSVGAVFAGMLIIFLPRAFRRNAYEE